MIGPCDSTCLWVTGAFAAAGAVALGTLDPEDAETIGDVTQLLPAAGGLTMTFLARDTQGTVQWLWAGGTSMVAIHGLKRGVEKARPNEDDNNSFPSGHTGASFFGAGFIHDRYGPRWGVPALILAGYTGLSRVNAQKHFGDDVVSGMSIGLMANWLNTSPISERVKINPLLAEKGLGLSVTVDPTQRDPRTEPEDHVHRNPRLRYEWEFGDTEVVKNDVRAPSDGGDLLDFQFNEHNDPTVSGRVSL
jgi:hypothetical protein